jgi:hypothetical protein
VASTEEIQLLDDGKSTASAELNSMQAVNSPEVLNFSNKFK